MSVLITGGSGFVAPHLARELLKQNRTVVLTSRQKTTLPPDLKKCLFHVCDLANAPDTANLINSVQPNEIIHLAGYTHVGASEKNEKELQRANIQTTENICKALSQTKQPVTLLFTSSGLVYSGSKKLDQAYDESSATHPTTTYGASKLEAEKIVSQTTAPHIRTYIVRPFNHTGPGQSSHFVVPGLAKKVAKAPFEGTIEAGNLEPYRDFSDVRDIVRAYGMILDKKPKEELFVLGSGQATKIKDLLDELILISGKKIRPVLDKRLLRTVDPDVVVANPEKARKVLGWKSERPFSKTLKEIYLEACR